MRPSTVPPSTLMAAVAGGGAAPVGVVRAAADLAIRWPTGATETVPNVAADQLVVIREGSGILSRQRFG